MYGFAALDFRPRQRYTADKAASDKAAAAFDNILLYFTPVQTLHKIWDRPDLPSPPYHIELSSMSRALMETDLYQFAVEKSIRKTIQGTLISNSRNTMLDGYALYDEESRHNVLLTDYADDIIECVQQVNPDAVVHVYPHGFTVSSLTRGECNALGRAIAKSALSAFTVSVPYVRLIERAEDTKDDKA